MLFVSPLGDLWQFHQEQELFTYHLHLNGFKLAKIRNFQSQLTPSSNVHLCILDWEHQLSYFRWNGVEWRKINIWDAVHPSFQFTLDGEDNFHLIVFINNKSVYFHYNGSNWTANELDSITPEENLLRFTSVENTQLLLISETDSPTSKTISAYFLTPTQEEKVRKTSILALPSECQNLQVWTCPKNLYIGYLLPKEKPALYYEFQLATLSKKSLTTKTLNTLPGLITEAADPILFTYQKDLIMLITQKHQLIYWRSFDKGQTWSRKMEIACPGHLKLAPVYNYRGDISPFVALKSFYNLQLTQPALLSTEGLLSLCPLTD